MSASKDNRQRDQVAKLEKDVKSLRDQLQRALAENQRLRKQLEEALRSLKRQAAPFSRGDPKANPKPPGRKPGAQYGERASRPVPARVNQQIAVPLPKNCWRCGGPVIHQQTRPQFQEDIVRLTIVRRFDVEVGCCARCGRHLQGRHPLQTSDALSAGRDLAARPLRVRRTARELHGPAAGTDVSFASQSSAGQVPAS